MSKTFKIIRDGQEVVTISGAVEVSDGYHTFEELYEHRIELFLALCRNVPSGAVWRSRLHADGSAYDGWFIMGIYRSQGAQITYHLPISRWEETEWVNTVARAPQWDGHTPVDVLARLRKLL